MHKILNIMNMRGSYWHLPAHVTTKHKCFWEAERIHEVPGFRNVNKSKAFNLQPLVEAKQLNASLTEDHKLSLANYYEKAVFIWSHLCRTIPICIANFITSSCLPYTGLPNNVCLPGSYVRNHSTLSVLPSTPLLPLIFCTLIFFFIYVVQCSPCPRRHVVRCLHRCMCSCCIRGPLWGVPFLSFSKFFQVWAEKPKTSPSR